MRVYLVSPTEFAHRRASQTVDGDRKIAVLDSLHLDQIVVRAVIGSVVEQLAVVVQLVIEGHRIAKLVAKTHSNAFLEIPGLNG